MTFREAVRRLTGGSGTTRLDNALAMFDEAAKEVTAAAAQLDAEACALEEEIADLQYRQSEILQREERARRVAGRLQGLLR